MELLLNVYAASKARGSIADFMGHCAVDLEEASHRLTPGLWLVRPSFDLRNPPPSQQIAPLNIMFLGPHLLTCCSWSIFNVLVVHNLACL